MDKYCLGCNILLVKAQNLSSKNWEKKKFCSYKCSNKARPDRGGKVKIECYFCKEDFIAKKHKLNNSKLYCSKECRSQDSCGENHWNWKGGITSENRKQRQSKEYNDWRKAVYKRDYWTCQDCKIKQKHPIAHHLKTWNEYPEERFNKDNGITLCRSCHKIRHKEIGMKTRFKTQITYKFKFA